MYICIMKHTEHTPEVKEQINVLENLMFEAHQIINEQQELIDGYQSELEALGY